MWACDSRSITTSSGVLGPALRPSAGRSWRRGPALVSILGVTTALLCPSPVAGHAPGGEIPPLLREMEKVVSLLEKGQGAQALARAEKLFEHFRDGGKPVSGLRFEAARIDRVFGTNVEGLLVHAVKAKEPATLRKGLRALAFFLMLERFNTVQKIFAQKPTPATRQKETFSVGRNYFILIFEESLAEKDPLLQQQIDRALNSMLGSIEDRDVKCFSKLKEEVAAKVADAFNIEPPGR